jgi:tail-anchored protein insertion receptor
MFDFTIKTLYSICTEGLRIFLLILYAKQPIFWLPQGLVPYYAEWLLSFPYAPLGSIGILAWQLACASVISLVNDAVVAISALVLESGRNPEQKKNEETTKHSDEKTTT